MTGSLRLAATFTVILLVATTATTGRAQQLRLR